MKFTNFALLLILVVGPATLGVLGYQSAGWLLLLSIASVLLAINVSPDRFEELALGPLRAKLRQKIAEADELSHQLKQAITLTLSIAVSAAMRTGRFAFETGKLQKQVYEQAIEIAKNANLDTSNLDLILSEVFKFIEIDMRYLIVGNEIYHDKESERLRKTISNEETEPLQRLQMMRQLASREGGNQTEIDEWLSDYEELIKKRNLRRPSVWWSHDERKYNDFIIKKKEVQR